MSHLMRSYAQTTAGVNPRLHYTLRDLDRPRRIPYPNPSSLVGRYAPKPTVRDTAAAVWSRWRTGNTTQRPASPPPQRANLLQEICRTSHQLMQLQQNIARTRQRAQQRTWYGWQTAWAVGRSFGPFLAGKTYTFSS